MNIEELNLDDFDISEIEIDEALEENFKNIIYSQPFFCKDDFDYEFRVTFDKDNIILDEIRYCETADFENCVEIQNNVTTLSLEHAMTLIKNDIDIRDKNTHLTNDIIHILNEGDENFHLLLEENKKAILKDIYNDIKETVLL